MSKAINQCCPPPNGTKGVSQKILYIARLGVADSRDATQPKKWAELGQNIGQDNRFLGRTKC